MTESISQSPFELLRESLGAVLYDASTAVEDADTVSDVAKAFAMASLNTVEVLAELPGNAFRDFRGRMGLTDYSRAGEQADETGFLAKQFRQFNRPGVLAASVAETIIDAPAKALYRVNKAAERFLGLDATNP